MKVSLQENGKITSKEYCKINNVVKDTANRDLSDLLKKEIVKREGIGKGVYYVLK